MAKIFVVPHTHWDRKWYLPFQAFRIRLVRLMEELLAILRDEPDYRCFTLDGQAIVLEDVLDILQDDGEAVEGRLRLWHPLRRAMLVN